MLQSNRAGQPSTLRPATRLRARTRQVPASGQAKRRSGRDGVSNPSKPALETARRIAEGVIIAVASSASLYLVGSVYADAYYGRLAIEVTSLDLAPTYVGLQSVHALWGLLEYPLILLLIFVAYRIIASPARRLGTWVAHLRRHYPRQLTILTNLALVAPLLAGDFFTGLRDRRLPHQTVLTEITSVLETAGILLLVYVVWLGWSQRRFLISEIRARKLVPIALLFVVYLLSALASTAVIAEFAAEELLTGTSDASLRVEFVGQPDVLPELAGKELILVTVRGSAYYVVEREVSPSSSQAPTSYVIPFSAVEAAQVTRFP